MRTASMRYVRPRQIVQAYQGSDQGQFTHDTMLYIRFNNQHPNQTYFLALGFNNPISEHVFTWLAGTSQRRSGNINPFQVMVRARLYAIGSSTFVGNVQRSRLLQGIRCDATFQRRNVRAQIHFRRVKGPRLMLHNGVLRQLDIAFEGNSRLVLAGRTAPIN